MNRRNQERQRGVVTVEVAVIVSILIPFCMGIIDASRFLGAGNDITRSAREGAVWAARGMDPVPIVASSLRSAGLDETKVIVNMTTVGEGTGAEVVLEVIYDLTNFSLFPWDDLFPSTSVASMVVRHE